MNRAAFGHVATAILREIGKLGRIATDGREKTILVVEDVAATDWASLTFVGQRHVFDLRIEGEAAPVAAAVTAIGRELAGLDVPITGHFVAEIKAMPCVPPVATTSGSVAQALRIEALVLCD